MEELDRTIRNATYRLFVELARAPSPDEVASVAGVSRDDIGPAWRRLHEVHALVLDPSGELRTLNPFSAVPTVHRVEAGGRSWFANCAWDAIGICAALQTSGTIDSLCPDCGEEITLSIDDAWPSDTALLFHALVPAASWWDDIVFT